jgi:hypothetical protein
MNQWTDIGRPDGRAAGMPANGPANDRIPLRKTYQNIFSLANAAMAGLSDI